MEINGWFSGCLVQAFPWIDGKYIYVNVRRFLPGQSISQAPAWDRSIFVLDDESGRTIVYKYTDSLVNAISTGKIPDKAHITCGSSKFFV